MASPWWSEEQFSKVSPRESPVCPWLVIFNIMQQFDKTVEQKWNKTSLVEYTNWTCNLDWVQIIDLLSKRIIKFHTQRYSGYNITELNVMLTTIKMHSVEDQLVNVKMNHLNTFVCVHYQHNEGRNRIVSFVICNTSLPSIFISRLWCCPCPILWGWQSQSPSIVSTMPF